MGGLKVNCIYEFDGGVDDKDKALSVCFYRACPKFTLVQRKIRISMFCTESDKSASHTDLFVELHNIYQLKMKI